MVPRDGDRVVSVLNPDGEKDVFVHIRGCYGILCAWAWQRRTLRSSRTLLRSFGRVQNQKTCAVLLVSAWREALLRMSLERIQSGVSP